MAGIIPQDTIFNTTIQLIEDNIHHFTLDESEQGQRLFSGLVALKDGLNNSKPLLEDIRKKAGQFDFR